MKRILIIDTKAGNLFSLKSAIKKLGFSVVVVEKTSCLGKKSDETFDGIVIPGQGRFGTVVKHMIEQQWPAYLQEAFNNNIPILGICVGMQVFFEASDEDPNVNGFAWFKGKAQALNFPKKPMVGWATLTSQLQEYRNSVVYFVNSYSVKQSDLSVAQTTYGETFCAAVKKGSFTGVQFHPEKSSKVGSEIILKALQPVLDVSLDTSSKPSLKTAVKSSLKTGIKND